MSRLFDVEIRLPDAAKLRQASQQLADKGFVVLPGIVADATVFGLRDHLEELASNAEGRFGDTTDLNSDGTVGQVHGLDRRSDIAFDFVRQPQLVSLMEQLAKRRVICFLTEYFSAAAADDVLYPPRQDHSYRQEHFDDEVAYAAWMPLTSVGSEDGPIDFADYSPAVFDFRQHERSGPAPFAPRSLRSGWRGNFHTVTATPGDLVVYHAFTVHRVSAFTSNTKRKVLIAHYRTSERKDAQNPMDPS